VTKAFPACSSSPGPTGRHARFTELSQSPFFSGRKKYAGGRTPFARSAPCRVERLIFRRPGLSDSINTRLPLSSVGPGTPFFPRRRSGQPAASACIPFRRDRRSVPRRVARAGHPRCDGRRVSGPVWPTGHATAKAASVYSGSPGHSGEIATGGHARAGLRRGSPSNLQAIPALPRKNSRVSTPRRETSVLINNMGRPMPRPFCCHKEPN